MTEEIVTDAQVDVGDLMERERVKDVEKSRRKVREDIETAEMAVQDGRISEDAANIAIARSVEMHVRELQYALEKTDKGQPYWNDETIGTWQIGTPPIASLAWNHKLNNSINFIPPRSERDYSSLPDGYEFLHFAGDSTRRIDVTGLAEFLDIQWKHTASHAAVFRIRNYGTETIQAQAVETFPRKLSKRAYSLTNKFLGELDLGLDVDAGRPFANYSNQEVVE